MLNFAQFLFPLIQPGSLILVVLMFLMGTGIADFLGSAVDLPTFWIGLTDSILLILSSRLLDLFFRTFDPALASPIQDAIKQKKPNLSLLDFRKMMLQFGITTLTIGAVFTALLIAQGKINLATLTILGISFFLSFFYAVPPITLSRKGLGEVIETILVANLIPAFGLLLQTGEIHRLLFMLTVPVTVLMLAVRLAQALPGYGKDVFRGRENMMTSMGWERGMRFHNFLILIAYVLMAAAFVFDLPWSLVWPGLLTLPIGLYEILQIRQISNGMKPNWNVLNLTTIALVGFTIYLITLSLWIG